MKITKEKKVLNLIVFIGCIFVGGIVFSLSHLPSFSLFKNIFYCRFKDLTRLPCISCGLTRSIFYITKGRFIESLSENPLGLWGLILWLWMLVSSGVALFSQRYFLWKIFPWKWYILGGIIFSFVFWILKVFTWVSIR